MFKWFEIQRLLSRISMRLRKEMIKMAGLDLKKNYFLDSPFWGPRDDVKRLSVYSEMQDIIIPQFLEKSDKFTFSFPRRYIYEIPNAIIDPLTGLVYDQDGELIAESSAWDFQRLLFDIPKPRISAPSRVLKGKYIFLPSMPNYYHWLLEDLPAFLGSYQYDKDAKILFGAHDFPPINDFIKSYLPDGVIKCQSPVRVERLILTGKNSGLGNPISYSNIVHPYDLEALKKWFDEYIATDNIKNDNPTMLYLSRSRTKKRKIAGEEMLEVALEKLGFTIFHGDLDLFDQIRLFSKASVVMGSQGASMSNLIWTPVKTKVIEIHYPKRYYPFFYNMGIMLDLDYQFLEVPEHAWTESDINSIVIKVKNIINNKDDNT